MFSRLRRTIKFAAALIGVFLLTIIGVRIYDSQRGLPLEPWLIHAPQEMSRAELDAGNWPDYLKKETEIFVTVKRDITQKLDPDARIPFNRYLEGSRVNPENFAQNFNRSFVLEPQGRAKGIAVFLHGLTDSPYSHRHFAKLYRDLGFIAIVPRLPGHGTVPAGLTAVQWEDWQAATRLVLREAQKRFEPGMQLHLVGYSNGGALALKYALDAMDDESLARPDKIVLVSPMIGITRFARFAGIAGWPAILPAFAKAAWLDVLPEFNPFKYNSFPVNAARQSHRLTRALQERIEQYHRDGRIARLPPVITFQSVMDSTVSTPSVISALYQYVPENGSELVLFDINRTIKFDPLIRNSADTLLARILPAGPQRYRTTILTNAANSNEAMVERTIEAGTTEEKTRPLDLLYPTGFFSLSHIALPFPVTDGLYGVEPDPADDFGLKLGAIAPRGERNVLVVSLDTLLRAMSNPFFPYLLQRLESGMEKPPS